MPEIIQIAGIRDYGEALMAAEAGADWIGFPLRLAYHREDMNDAQTREVIKKLGNRVLPVLITYLDKAAEIDRLARHIGARGVQLHGPVEPAELAALRGLAPFLVIVKSLIIGKGDFAEIEEEIKITSEHVDYYITDTYDPATGACGATGKTHDPAASRAVVKISPRPVIMAGGLTPDNVAETIREVRPAGVDVHTGIEDKFGRKNKILTELFIERARAEYKLQRMLSRGQT